MVGVDAADARRDGHHARHLQNVWQNTSIGSLAYVSRDAAHDENSCVREGSKQRREREGKERTRSVIKQDGYMLYLDLMHTRIT